jgi:hypothetical protein
VYISGRGFGQGIKGDIAKFGYLLGGIAKEGGFVFTGFSRDRT